MIQRKELIKRYIEFFKSKKHKEIPNSSLIPNLGGSDTGVLFTTAGMHPLVPYLLGQKHPHGKRLCGVQKCIRTIDIEEVGDSTHHTFFEMLGNWSLGDYFKKEAIEYSFEFLTKVLKIKKDKISVTCFKGDKDAKKDEESAKFWISQGIPKERIKFLSKSDNWWGPAGETGPCGPDTEMFVNSIEIWNDVFMEYNKNSNGKFEPLKQKNVDTGMGVERTLATLNNLDDNYLTEVWKPIIEEIEKISKQNYENLSTKPKMRIIADHIKASVFILAEGITPSNTEQGYVLRRLIRRAVRFGRELRIKNFASKIAEPVFRIYDDYPELKKNKKFIMEELKKEENKFELTIERGMNKFKKFSENKKLSGEEAFLLFQSYGFPIEITRELAKENQVKLDEKEFQKELEKHKELSRTASKGKFKSGLADNSEQTTKLHTAAHLLLAAIQKVLKDKDIMQKGSNITPERLRLDFSFPRKLTEEEIKKIEDLVNEQIKKSTNVTREEMSPKEAKKKGASGIFNEKYGDKVSVYTIGDFSKEICTGPHVKNTREIGKFKITKEESSSSGVRRIRASLG
ncbi:MAG: alanine--tRNA ligase [Nanoarchaeota archaeon]|nr:alanine--tRNA ligase [Nanoarchaeota archaeon]